MYEAPEVFTQQMQNKPGGGAGLREESGLFQLLSGSHLSEAFRESITLFSLFGGNTEKSDIF